MQGGQGMSETICDEAAEGLGNTNGIRNVYGYNINVCNEPSFDTLYKTFIDNFGMVPKIYLNI